MAIGAIGERAVGRVARALLAAVGLLLAGNACIGGVCTLEDCSNAAWVQIGRDGAWQEGTYTLEISLEDQEPLITTFVVPDDLPPETQSRLVDFGDDRVRATFSQRRECTSTGSQDGNSDSGTCTPIPDAYELELELVGNPKTVGVTLTRDEQTLLSDTRSPKYERDYPNGSNCDEGCSAASYELTFED